MGNALSLIGVIGGLGLIFGLILAFVNKKFGIKLNPLVEEVEEELPKGQCGSCGFAGCRQYAEAVVLRSEVAPNLCSPGGNDVAKIVGRLTGKAAAEIQPSKAVVLCGASADLNQCVVKHKYDGLDDCAAANMIYAGEKACEYGCLGYGNCARACPYGAITIDETHLPVIDPKICVGCGVCVETCPRLVIALAPATSLAVIRCRNKDKGAVTKKICTVGCIGCGICAKACPHKAIVVAENLARVNFEVCQQCNDPVCLSARCMPKTIQPFYNVKAPVKEAAA